MSAFAVIETVFGGGMFVRRKEFLALTGLTLTGLNNLARRELLPFESRRAVARGWTPYTVEQAVLVALSNGLAAGGLDRSVARSTVAGLHEERRLTKLVRGGGGYVGNARVGDLETTIGYWVAGDLSAIEQQLVAYTATLRSNSWVQGLVLLNVADALVRMRVRAGETGLGQVFEDGLKRFGGRQ